MQWERSRTRRAPFNSNPNAYSNRQVKTKAIEDVAKATGDETSVDEATPAAQDEEAAEGPPPAAVAKTTMDSEDDDEDE